MSKRSAEEYIPHDIQKAAKDAGLSTPLWYVGRSNGHQHKKLTSGLGVVVQRARDKRNLGPAKLVERDSVSDDKA